MRLNTKQRYLNFSKINIHWEGSFAAANEPLEQETGSAGARHGAFSTSPSS